MMIVLCLLCLLQSSPANPRDSFEAVPETICPFFGPPPQFAGDFGPYRSPLKFDDGTPVKTPADWQKRRQEILTTWRNVTGFWPPLIEKPEVRYLEQTHRDNFTQHKVTVEIAPGKQTLAGYLLIPDRNERKAEDRGPPIRTPQSEIRNQFPAVLVVFYDAETGVGLGKELRDFGCQLAKRGFVVLSIGTPEFASLNPP